MVVVDEHPDISNESAYWQQRIAAANEPEDVSKNVKMHRYIPVHLRSLVEPPIDVEFTTGLSQRLVRKRTFSNKGRLVDARWYADEAATELIVRIDYEYELDAIGWPVHETRTFTWYCEDDTACEQQKIEVVPFNDQLAKIATLERWRSNQIRVLKMRTIELLVYTTPAGEGQSEPEVMAQAMTIGREFLANHKIHFLNYVEDSHPGVINLLQTAPDLWLDNEIPHVGITIRQYLLSDLL